MSTNTRSGSPVKRNDDPTHSVQCRGAVIVEACLVLPLLIIFLAVILTEVAGEGVRLGSRIQSLEVGSFTGGTSVVSTSRHQSIHSRIATALDIHASEIKADVFEITTRCTNAGPIANVSVEIRARFRGVFPIYSGLPIAAHHESSYLASNQCII